MWFFLYRPSLKEVQRWAESLEALLTNQCKTLNPTNKQSIKKWSCCDITGYAPNDAKTHHMILKVPLSNICRSLPGQMVWPCSVTSCGPSSARRIWTSGWLWRSSRGHALPAGWPPGLQKSTRSSSPPALEDRSLPTHVTLPFGHVTLLLDPCSPPPGQRGLRCPRINQSEPESGS